MAIITGPDLDRAKKELTQWYLDTRAKLIKALEEVYPYGKRRLSPQEQLERFLSMTPAEWQFLETKLMERHRGQPNQRQLVEDDLRAYTTRMTRLMGGAR